MRRRSSSSTRVGLSRRQNVYPADIALIFPIAKTGKPRKYHIPDQPPVSAEALLAEGKWQRVSWPPALNRGAKILWVEPAGRCHHQDARCHDQGQMGL